MIFRFENKEYWFYFLLIPALIAFAFFIRWFTNYKLGKVGDKKVIQTVFPLLSSFYYFFKYGMLVLAAILLLVGLLNPQTGSESITKKAVGLEVNFVVDVSNSMLAEDVKPNRLTAAKKIIAALSNRLREHKIGITVFAGEAFNQIPPTADRNIVDAVVTALSPDLVPTQGSSFKAAFQMAVQNFSPDNQQKKFLIFITDGENHGERFLSEIRSAKDQGISTHVIGIGGEKGANIPIYNRNGGRTFLKDAQGKLVVSALNEDFLQSISDEGAGIYANGKEAGRVNSIAQTINSTPKKIVVENLTSNFKDFFVYFIAAALGLILLEFFIPKNKIVKTL